MMAGLSRRGEAEQPWGFGVWACMFIYMYGVTRANQQIDRTHIQAASCIPIPMHQIAPYLEVNEADGGARLVGEVLEEPVLLHHQHAHLLGVVLLWWWSGLWVMCLSIWVV